MASVRNINNSGGRKWKRIFDHQGWVRTFIRTKENYRIAYFNMKYHVETEIIQVETKK